MIKKLKVTVDGKTYHVSVDVPDVSSTPAPSAAAHPASTIKSEPSPASSAGSTPAPPRMAASGEIVSPLAGRVISIGVQAGQDVQEGAHVLTLEAMKMNTFVFAPKTGKIKEIRTTVGAAVQEGEVLLLME